MVPTDHAVELVERISMRVEHVDAISLSTPRNPRVPLNRFNPIMKLLAAGFLISPLPSVILDSAEVSAWREATLLSAMLFENCRII
jgi:hypothetical protein